MYTNKLAEVHVNSIPNEAIRTISSQFNFFFCEKISSVQKRKSTKTNQQKLKKANEKQQRKRFFCAQKLPRR